MIQDIAPKTYHNEYREKEASGSDTVLVYRGREALVKRDDKGEIRFPRFPGAGESSAGLSPISLRSAGKTIFWENCRENRRRAGSMRT